LHGSVDDDIAVIIEPAHPSSTAPLVLSSLGLTRRESEVALLVLRGASTKAIGAELHLSVYHSQRSSEVDLRQDRGTQSA
jgi:DNA-binding NarL/FixJ family response regulator